MRPRNPKHDPQFSNRKAHMCECGNHVWAHITRGYIVLVSPEDAYLIEESIWCAKVCKKVVYAYRKGNKALHRMIMVSEGNQVIDHLYRNGLDNRREMLRVASRSENICNTNSKRPGYTWLARIRKYQVQIRANGKRIYVGVFSDERTAREAYLNACKLHRGYSWEAL